MSIMVIKYKKKAIKAINAMDKITKHRIRKAIEGLTLNPPQGDIKELLRNKLVNCDVVVVK